MEWPDNPLWDYSVELYRRPGVEAACLELQRRHGLDVNLVLLCCWLASSGVELDALRARAGAVASWQAEVVRLLRALRQRLKARLADPEPRSVVERCPGLAAAIRERALALEIDGERLAQLGLRQAVDGVHRQRRPGRAGGRQSPPPTGNSTAAIGMPCAACWALPFPLPGRAMWRRASTGSMSGPAGPAPFAPTAGGRSNVMKMPRFYVMG